MDNSKIYFSYKEKLVESLRSKVPHLLALSELIHGTDSDEIEIEVSDPRSCLSPMIITASHQEITWRVNIDDGLGPYHEHVLGYMARDIQEFTQTFDSGIDDILSVLSSETHIVCTNDGRVRHYESEELENIFKEIYEAIEEEYRLSPLLFEQYRLIFDHECLQARSFTWDRSMDSACEKDLKDVEAWVARRQTIHQRYA